MGNLENIKDDDRNKSGSIVGGGGGANVKTRKGMEINTTTYLS